MPLPDINLDDLRAQTLLDEARLKIKTLAPEWTDYNVSDPGITLLELFAWKTEKLAYRLNRVPDKMLRRLMDLIGIDKLAPAVSAKANITFRLVAPLIAKEGDEGRQIDIPAGTQVATRRLNSEPEVVFTTRASLRVGPLAIDRVLFSGNAMAKSTPNPPSLGRVEFRKDAFALFGENPQHEDAFYISFTPMLDGQTPAGHVVRMVFGKRESDRKQSANSREATGSGYIATKPPWVWEYHNGTDWAPLPLGNAVGNEADTTGGFNESKGALVLYLPADMQPVKPDTWDTEPRYWVRCRHVYDEKNPLNDSPRVDDIEVQVIGGAVLAENAVVVDGELLGMSDGRPGQAFTFRHTPMLALEPHVLPDLDECVEVEMEGSDGLGKYQSWKCVPDFGDSTPFSRHYMLDEVSGEIVFGPAVRQRDGTVKQFGRVPALGRRIRVSRYRYSLGALGNVTAGKIIVPKTAIPFVDRVHNREDARGGQDVESMELARLRAQHVMKTQGRAVTTKDFENLLLTDFNLRRDRGRRHGDLVARSHCLTHADMKSIPVGAVKVVLVPGPFDPDALHLAALEADGQLLKEVGEYLRDYKILTSELSVEKVQFKEIDVRVTLPRDTTALVGREAQKLRVTQVVKRLLAPAVMADREAAARMHLKAGLPIDDDMFDEGWAGWPFGKPLDEGVVQATLMRLPAVRHVLKVEFLPVANQSGEPGGDSAAQTHQNAVSLGANELPLLRRCEVMFA